ncbi:hypothetical protein, partial [Streptomyces sp. DSM 118148]|uniref:hypothetical protein n=1 Tax=Streptomyces sp. DSM 118148 TaxID=3448667 RepID=UPI0040402924
RGANQHGRPADPTARSGHTRPQRLTGAAPGDHHVPDAARRGANQHGRPADPTARSGHTRPQRLTGAAPGDHHVPDAA